jgi:hypothetical protein
MLRQVSRLTRCPEIVGTVCTSPLWLPLAVMAMFFAQKSHAALFPARNPLNSGDYPRFCDMFDSHRPLHSPANAGQCEPMICRLQCRAISWRTFAGIGCGFTRSLVRMTRVRLTRCRLSRFRRPAVRMTIGGRSTESRNQEALAAAALPGTGSPILRQKAAKRGSSLKRRMKGSKRRRPTPASRLLQARSSHSKVAFASLRSA